MRLVWDQSQQIFVVNGIELALAPENSPPFGIDAEVEEQDVALILSENETIQINEDKPLWYYAHKLETQTIREPGSIMIKPGAPLRLLALIHDFDHDPSWREEWIETALRNIFDLAENRKISSIKLTILGAKFGHYKQEHFLALLKRVLSQNRETFLKRIWLVLPPQDIKSSLDFLKQASVE